MKMKNHFEAAEEMQEIAIEKLGPDVEGNAEIDWDGVVCEGGLNVEGHFHNPNGESLVLFWDAAWQEFKVS